MRLPDHSSHPGRRRAAVAALLLGGAVLALSACSTKVSNGLLPQGVTDHAERVRTLWIGSWIAALGVGVLVWGLILWCIVAYHKRKDDVGLPEQLRYNVPLEILYTTVPVMMVSVLFFYTVRDESALLDVSKKPDVTINVIGKQWSWDFNYIEANTYESGTQAELTGQPGVEQTLPTLYLPVHKRVEFVLTARDVIHSFWVPAFLQKLDMLPGVVNRFQVVTTQTGTFAGKCAELCGAYHSHMLFNVKVVSEQDFQKHLAELKARGNNGQLDNSLNRQPVMHQYDKLIPTSGSK